MFSASYFTYDGVYSGEYGLQIASFDSQSVETTSVFAPTLTTSKATRAKRFQHNGIKYEQPPTFQFSIISEMPIDELNRRRILAWITGRNQFKVLKIHQQDLDCFTYKCVFTAVDIIFVRGQCHGFQVTATFDSWFCSGKPAILEFAGNGSTVTKTIVNKSDIYDDYVYPSIELVGVQNLGSNIFCTIKNNTDNNARVTQFSGLANSETLFLDGETRVINNSNDLGRLSCFNKNWLRLKKGKNVLEITVNGTIRIICPTYVIIGF